MDANEIRTLSVGVAAALLAACGSGSGGSFMNSPAPPASQTGNVAMLPVARSVDIETAEYGSRISTPDAGGFTMTRLFRTAEDDYVHTLHYILNSTANGTDDSGNAIDGCKWWNFAYPTFSPIRL